MSHPEQGSEYRQFVETLRRLGVEYSLDYAPTKKVWQRRLSAHGFNITAWGCNAIVVGDIEYLFSTGCAYCLGGYDQGPTGVFLMQRNTKTGKVVPRKYYRGDGVFVSSGLDALLMKYPSNIILVARAK